MLSIETLSFSLFDSRVLVHLVFYTIAISSFLCSDACEGSRKFGFLPSFQLIFFFCSETDHSRVFLVFLNGEVEVSSRFWIGRYLYFRNRMDVPMNVFVRAGCSRFCWRTRSYLMYARTGQDERRTGRRVEHVICARTLHEGGRKDFSRARVTKVRVSRDVACKENG